jgi:hypothetical protein
MTGAACRHIIAGEEKENLMQLDAVYKDYLDRVGVAR